MTELTYVTQPLKRFAVQHRKCLCVEADVVPQRIAYDFEVSWIANSTDEALMEALRSVPDTPLANRLRHRRLYKRVLDLPASHVPSDSGGWLSERPDLVEQVEDAVAKSHRLAPGTLLIDFPKKPQMLYVELPVRTRSGKIERVDGPSGADWLGIQRVREELHTAARRLRVFAADPIRIEPSSILGLAERTSDEIQQLIGSGSF